MKKIIFILLNLTLLAETASAKGSCDLYFESQKIEKSHEDFDKISGFFGFKNDKRTFTIRFIEGKETKYWTTEAGKILEQSTYTAAFSGKFASLELSQTNRGDWRFGWTVLQNTNPNSKVSEVLYEGNPSKNTTIPDLVTTENSKLVITRSKVLNKKGSAVAIVIKHTMIFSKNEDGSIELTSFTTSDSIRGNRILIGEENSSRIILNHL